MNYSNKNTNVLQQQTYFSINVPKKSGNVKEKSSGSDSHSIAIPFSGAFMADKRKRYATAV